MKLGQGYVFTGVCDYVHRGSVYLTPPSGDTHHSRHPPPPPPTANNSGRYGQCAGGTHPTGMQSCYIFFYLLKLTSVKEVEGTTCIYLLMQIAYFYTWFLF